MGCNLGVFFAGTVYLITQPKTLAFGVGAGLMSIVLAGALQPEH